MEGSKMITEVLEKWEICVRCNKEFDFYAGGDCTEGFIFVCLDCCDYEIPNRYAELEYEMIAERYGLYDEEGSDID